MLKRMLVGFIRSHETTGEQAKDPNLRTRYYKLSKDKVWAEVVEILKKTPGFNVLYEGIDVGEIVCGKRTVTGRMQDITVSLFSINPVNTAIDIHSASRGSLGDLGANYRTIVDICRQIDHRLERYKISK